MNNEYKYQEITCKSALNRIDSFLPYHYDLNIYRGCEHTCDYCFARYSHQYLEDSDFFHHIYVKENIVGELEKKLSSKTWKRDVINLGGITDSYQPVEAIYKIMQQILKLLIKYKTPAIISTKSALITRDITLLQELNQVAGIQIAFTITTLDNKLASVLESGASPIKMRLNAMKTLKEAGLTVGWHLMPIIPYITATRSNLKAIFQMAKECNVDYMITGMLNLRGSTKEYFFKFIKKEYPEYYKKIWNLYNHKEEKQCYKKQLYELLMDLEKEYHICRDYQKYVPKSKTNEQLQLF